MKEDYKETRPMKNLTPLEKERQKRIRIEITKGSKIIGRKTIFEWELDRHVRIFGKDGMTIKINEL